MDFAADVLGQVGVALASIGAFMLLMALLARPFLGRQPTDRSLREMTNPYEAAFSVLWRLRGWALRALALGCALFVPAIIYWAVSGT